MIKISLRLQTIAKFCDKEDSVVDIGADHGLLSLYLYKEKGLSSVFATDINEEALSKAKENFTKYNAPIPTFVGDGIKDLDLQDYNTLVIAGMGSHTIMHILSDKSKLRSINKIIISSHNHPELVRKHLNTLGYYLEDEVVIYDKHYYTIMKFLKGNHKHSEELNNYGLIKDENITYYEEIIKKNKEILNKNVNKKTYNKLQKDLKFYENVIEKIADRK